MDIVRAVSMLLMITSLCWLLGCGQSAEQYPEDVARISIYLDTEPPSLNTITSEDNTSYHILDHVTEGLLVYDLNHQLAPGVAHSWEFKSPTTVIFHLRQDALWSDGSPVTAHDFVFAWQQAVNPEVGSGYAYIMYPVKNGEAINSGHLPLDSLGVEAVNNHTLTVELEQPTPYFLSLTAFSVYRPIKQSFYDLQGQRYAADKDNLLYNGPFVISRWTHGAEMLLDKNPQYWNRQAIAIDQIAYPYFTNDPQTTLNLYRDGKVHMADIGEQGIKTALAERYNIRTKEPGQIQLLGFNLKPERVTSNLALRRAIRAIINTQEITNRVFAKAGSEPAASLFPNWIRRHFMEGFSLYQPTHLDQASINALLAKADAELPGNGIPAISFLTDDKASNAKFAEYLQQQFADRLGLELKISRQTFKQLLAQSNAGDYDIVSGSWAPDYDDPLAYAELLINKYEDGSRIFANSDVDRAFAIASASDHPATRNAAFRELHRIVVDQIPYIPYIATGGTRFALYVQSTSLSGVRRSNIAGDPNFNYARIQTP